MFFIFPKHNVFPWQLPTYLQYVFFACYDFHAKLKILNVANWKIPLFVILQFVFLKSDSPKRKTRILWEVNSCFLNISSLIIQNGRDMGCSDHFFSGKPEWYLLTWGQESSTILLQKSQEGTNVLTSHSLKEPDSNGFHCAILFWFPLVSHSKKKSREAKGESFMTVCNQPFVAGSLRLKGGSKGLVNGEIMKVPGQPKMRLEKICSSTHRLCRPVEQPSMDTLRNLIFASEPQISEVSKGLRRTSDIQTQ